MSTSTKAYMKIHTKEQLQWNTKVKLVKTNCYPSDLLSMGWLQEWT